MILVPGSRLFNVGSGRVYNSGSGPLLFNVGSGSLYNSSSGAPFI